MRKNSNWSIFEYTTIGTVAAAAVGSVVIGISGGVTGAAAAAGCGFFVWGATVPGRMNPKMFKGLMVTTWMAGLATIGTTLTQQKWADQYDVAHNTNIAKERAVAEVIDNQGRAPGQASRTVYNWAPFGFTGSPLSEIKVTAEADPKEAKDNCRTIVLQFRQTTNGAETLSRGETRRCGFLTHLNNS